MSDDTESGNGTVVNNEITIDDGRNDDELAVLDAAPYDIDNVDLSADALRTAELLAGTAALPPPADLLDDVLSRARQLRPVGPAHGEPPAAVTPNESFRRTADDLYAVLSSLGPDDWSMPTSTVYGTVGDVVAHLIGIERLALGWYGAAPMPPGELAANHQAVSASAIEEMADRGPHDVIELWHSTVHQVADAAAALPQDTFLMMHDIPGSVEASLLLRTFELWAHADDICEAVDQPLLAMDASRLLLLSSRLVGALPITFAVSGSVTPNAVTRLVLTGAGGGTYDVSFGDTSAPVPRATIVTSAVDICRLASRRITPSLLAASVEGDVTVADHVLAHVGAFSRD